MSNKFWFAGVRWCMEDLEAALEDCGYPATEQNIKKLHKAVQNRAFTEYMIQTGFEYMYDFILCECEKEKGDLNK